MGANTTQASGVALFLVAFTLLAAGIANESFLLDIVGLAVLAASAMIFKKCKPWEHAE
jgi:hypothetical protein